MGNGVNSNWHYKEEYGLVESGGSKEGQSHKFP